MTVVALYTAAAVGQTTSTFHPKRLAAVDEIPTPSPGIVVQATGSVTLMPGTGTTEVKAWLVRGGSAGSPVCSPVVAVTVDPDALAPITLIAATLDHPGESGERAYSIVVELVDASANGTDVCSTMTAIVAYPED